MTATNPMGNPARNPSADLPQSPVSTPDQERFLRMPEVVQMTGLSKTVIYCLIQADQFPKNYRITLRASGWKYSEVMHWMDSRPRVGGAV